MKFDIRKISDSYINVTAKEGTTSIDMDWLGKDDAKALLDSLNSTCDYLRTFIGIDDPRDVLVEALQEVHEWIVCAPIASAEDMMQNAEQIQEVVSDALAAAGAPQ